MPQEITKVEMLGGSALAVERTAEALVVTLPAQRPNEIAYAFRITPVSL
jgi:hypothetical protein